MGYCPYICVFCKKVKDNGWLCPNFLDDVLAELLTAEQRLELEAQSELSFPRLKYDVCGECLKHIPVQEF